VDLSALLDLLCVRDTNNSYCFYELEGPLLENNRDPVRTCESVYLDHVISLVKVVLCSSALSGGGCTTECESVSMSVCVCGAHLKL